MTRWLQLASILSSRFWGLNEALPECTVESCPVCFDDAVAVSPSGMTVTWPDAETQLQVPQLRIAQALSTWDSQAMLGRIVGILLKEKLAIDVTYVSCLDEVRCMLAMLGCASWSEGTCQMPRTDAEANSLAEAGLKVFSDRAPDIHITMEMWPRALNGSLYPAVAGWETRQSTEIGPSGFAVREGIYIDQGVFEQAWNEHGLSLGSFQAFTRPYTRGRGPQLAVPADFAETDLRDVLADGGCTGSEGLVQTGMARLQAMRYVCKESWWLSPACADLGGDRWRTECYALLDDDWNNFKDELYQAVANSRMLMAKLVVGYDGFADAVANTQRNAAFCWWNTDTTFKAINPVRVAFRDDISTWVTQKSAWLPVLQLQKARTLLGRVSLSDGQLDTVLNGLVNLRKETQLAYDPSSIFQKAACDWLRTSRSIWKAWLPDLASCAPGQEFSTSLGHCVACAAGRYSLPQAVGMFGSKSGGCVACKAGSFARFEGQTACVQCPPGQYQSPSHKGGSTACTYCPVGNYSEESGQTQCRQCPRDLSTLYHGGTGPTECACPKGQVQVVAGEKCQECPEGLSCPFGSSLVPGDPSARAEPVAVRGFMTLEGEPLTVYRCLIEGQCIGGPPGSCAANRDTSKVACGECKAGFYETSSDCMPCRFSSYVLLIVLCVVGIALGLPMLAFGLTRDAVRQPRSIQACIIMVGQILTGIQTMAVFYRLSFTWVEPLKSVLKAVSLLTFDMDMLRLACVVGPDPVMKHLARQVITPTCAVAVTLILAVKKFIWRSTSFRVDWVNCVGTIAYMFFITIVIVTITPVVCYRHPGNAGSSMVASPSVLCFNSSTHTALLVLSAGSLITMVLPFIALVTYATLQYPLLVARNQRGNAEMLRMFRFLFFRYKPEAYFFSSVTIARNLAICLVPVVFRDGGALQVLHMCALLLSSQTSQMWFKPWRSRMANALDGCLTALLVLLLVCCALTTDLRAGSSTVGVFATLVFVSFLASIVIALGYQVWQQCRRHSTYQWFICHHKADAAAQSRFLKMILHNLTGQSVFIDSDDLTNLHELFDIVRNHVDHVLVYLTRDTLRRPWCAGEIVTAYKNNKSVTVIKTHGFEAPQWSEPEELEEYLELSSVNLLEYGITMADVARAYEWVLKEVPCIELDAPLGCRKGFESLVLRTLGDDCPLIRSSHSRRSLLDLPQSSGMLVVCSDPDDDEATAAAGILVSKMQQEVLGFLKAGICVLADHSSASQETTDRCISSAHSVLVLLSRNSMQSRAQLRSIQTAMEMAEQQGLPVIPVHTPGFSFPSDQFFAEVLPSICPGTHEEMKNLIVGLFSRISVPLSTNASDSILDAQSVEVLRRVPRCQRAPFQQKSPSIDSAYGRSFSLSMSLGTQINIGRFFPGCRQQVDRQFSWGSGSTLPMVHRATSLSTGENREVAVTATKSGVEPFHGSIGPALVHPDCAVEQSHSSDPESDAERGEASLPGPVSPPSPPSPPGPSAALCLPTPPSPASPLSPMSPMSPLSHRSSPIAAREGCPVAPPRRRLLHLPVALAGAQRSRPSGPEVCSVRPAAPNWEAGPDEPEAFPASPSLLNSLSSALRPGNAGTSSIALLKQELCSESC